MKMNKEIIKEDMKKVPGAVIGFFICAYGIAQMKALNFGMSPWDTLLLGIINKIDIDYGVISQLVGFVVIGISILLKIYPGVGTILNMVFIGFFIDFIDKLGIIFAPENFMLKVLMMFVGITIFNYGVHSYLKFEIGAGPRDGLMVGLVQITGLDVKYVKTAIEAIVVVIGFLLGGKIGVGTVIGTISGGYILDKIFAYKDFNPKECCQRKFTDYIMYEKINAKE